MPLYEYECRACGNRFERIQKFSDPLVETCPKCEGAVRKRLSSPAIQFKGSGFYITDYAKKSSTAAGDKATRREERQGGEERRRRGQEGRERQHGRRFLREAVSPRLDDVVDQERVASAFSRRRQSFSR